MTELSNIFGSPDLYPVRFSGDRETVSFIQMTRESYRHSSFLDKRAWRVSPREYELPVSDLLRQSHEAESGRHRLHYILHPAFSCSTLLARYLELIPSCLVLKEPGILTHLAVAERGFPPHLLTLTLRMLGRRYTDDGIVIVKASDCSTVQGEAFLRHSERSRIVILKLALEAFLVAVLKSPQRRVWLHKRMQAARRAAAPFPRLAAMEPQELTDAQATAWLWLIHESLRLRLESIGESRVLSLDGDQIALSPLSTLNAVNGHLTLGLNPHEIDRMISHNAGRTDSKNASMPYGTDERAAEFTRFRNELGPEVDEGLKWAAGFIPKLPQAGFEDDLPTAGTTF